MDVRRVVESTGNPAWAVDQAGRIIAWNRAAERFFGWNAKTALQRGCADLLRGRDSHGNRYCRLSCPLLEMASHDEPVHQFEIELATAAGDLVPATVSVVTLRSDVEDELALVHQVVSPTKPAPARQPVVGQAPAHRGVGCLSKREVEVLRLIAAGLGTVRIAERLFISPATVRNHVQHLFEKLDVHSRIEAVALYHREHPR